MADEPHAPAVSGIVHRGFHGSRERLRRGVFRAWHVGTGACDRLRSRHNILHLPIPSFASLRPDIDPKLEAIIQRALERDRDKRYQSALEMLTALEVYIYGDGYGPTNEKLAVYLKKLLGIQDPALPVPGGRAPN